jgi:hypothetical protein
MTTKERYEQIIIELGRLLRGYDFKRSGSSFTREFEDVLQIVSVQKLASGPPDSIRFRINLGLWSKVVARRENESKKPAKAIDCHAYNNATILAGISLDYWQVLDGESSSAAVGQAKTLLIDNVIPKFDSVRTNSDLIRVWSEYVNLPRPSAESRELYLQYLRDSSLS